MTTDEQTMIIDSMQKNRFELTNTDLAILSFKKTEKNELIEVHFSKDFPYYVENKFARAGLPDNWARQTLMLKNFEKVKLFAEKEVKTTVDSLKKEFNKKFKNGEIVNGSEI